MKHPLYTESKCVQSKSFFFQMFYLAVMAIDPALGRHDYHSLSDQALMEMVFDGMKAEKKQKLQDEHGNFLDFFASGKRLRAIRMIA